jgi:hypothetical protein
MRNLAAPVDRLLADIGAKRNLSLIKGSFSFVIKGVVAAGRHILILNDGLETFSF